MMQELPQTYAEMGQVLHHWKRGVFILTSDEALKASTEVQLIKTKTYNGP